jgi:hypothetical protein
MKVAIASGQPLTEVRSWSVRELATAVEVLSAKD